MYDFNEERESFETWCKSFTSWDSDYLFSYDTGSYGYHNPDIENAFQCWLNSYAHGYDAGHADGYKKGKLDDRIGIDDRIRPDLMEKKLRDWGVV